MWPLPGCTGVGGGDLGPSQHDQRRQLPVRTARHYACVSKPSCDSQLLGAIVLRHWATDFTILSLGLSTCKIKVMVLTF